MLEFNRTQKGCMRNFPRYRTRVVFLLIAALSLLASPCLAVEWIGWSGPSIRNLFPVDTIQDYINPMSWSTTNFGNTFRSEMGFKFSAAEVQRAYLKGSEAGTIDLSPDVWADDQTLEVEEYLLQPYLNGMPLRLDVYMTFRIWRLGLRANYANFQSRSNRPGLGYIDLSGLSLGGDFDVVKREWLTMGICTDWYFNDPVFRGYVPANTVRAWAVRPSDDPAKTGVPWASADYNFFNGSIRGQKPATVGTYTRYVPPEILGFPVYFESSLNYGIKGSRVLSYGAALVFRPQIYRFDILARLKFLRLNLTFEEDTTNTVGPSASFTVPQTWQIDATWNIYSAEFGIYF